MTSRTFPVDLSNFPFNKLRFEVCEDSLYVSVYMDNMLLKTWKSYTPIPIGSSATITGLRGTLDLTEEDDE